MHQPPPAAFGRLGRKVAAPLADRAPWGAPPIADLLEAIDAALKQRGHA